MSYTLTITAEQARTLSSACELLGRLGMGQVHDAFNYLPANRYDARGLADDLATIEQLIGRHHISGGICAAPPASQTAWDLYQVLRHRLAWDRHQDGEDVTAVDFRDPMRFGPEPLATIAKDQA